MSDDMTGWRHAWTHGVRGVGLLLAVVLVVTGGVLAVRSLSTGQQPSQTSSAARSGAATGTGTGTATVSSSSPKSSVTPSAPVSSAPAAVSPHKAATGYRAAPRFTKRESTAGRVAAVQLADFLRAGSVALHRPGRTAGPELTKLSVGVALGEERALREQYAEMGYRVVGAPRVTSVALRSVNLAAHPPTAVLAACLDNSHVDVLDQRGRSQKAQMYSSKAPVLNVYQLHYVGSRWRVATHVIPNRSTCSIRGHGKD